MRRVVIVFVAFSLLLNELFISPDTLETYESPKSDLVALFSLFPFSLCLFPYNACKRFKEIRYMIPFPAWYV